MTGFLSDGKEHNKDVIKAIKPKTGRIVNKTKRLQQDWGQESKLCTLNVAEDGTLQMIVADGTPAMKPAAKKSAKK